MRNHYLERKKQEKIKGILTLYAGCSAIMEVTCRQYHAVVEGAVVQQASNRPLDEERVRKQIQKTGDTEFVFEQLEIFMGDDIFMPMQQLNELRRNALESLERKMTDPFRRTLPVRMDEKDRSVRKEKDSPRGTATLYLDADFKTCYPGNMRMMWKAIAEELQKFGGHSGVNWLFRANKGVLYREILKDVCKYQKVKGVDFKKDSISTIENAFLQKTVELAIEKMSEQERKELIDGLRNVEGFGDSL